MWKQSEEKADNFLKIKFSSLFTHFETARNLKQMGMPILDLAKATGLSPDEVENYKTPYLRGHVK